MSSQSKRVHADYDNHEDLTTAESLRHEFDTVVEILFRTARDAATQTVNEAAEGVTRQVAELESRNKKLDASLNTARLASETIQKSSEQALEGISHLEDAVTHVEKIRKSFEHLDQEIVETTNRVAGQSATRAVDEAAEGVRKQVAELVSHGKQFESSVEQARQTATILCNTEAKIRDGLAALENVLAEAKSISNDFGNFRAAVAKTAAGIDNAVVSLREEAKLRDEDLLGEVNKAINERFSELSTKIAKEMKESEQRTQPLIVTCAVVVTIITSIAAIAS